MPTWQDESLGTMVRIALWLRDVVREGNVFTKAQLREAFPGVEQVDRRMRDLRPHHWRIDTARDDVRLSREQLRFVTMGAPVWDGRGRAVQDTISAKERRRTFAADSFACVLCGISPGERYTDAPALTAKLRAVRREGGGLATECDRCWAGRSEKAPSLQDVIARIDGLSQPRRLAFAAWCAADEREQDPAAVAWALYRALGTDDREAVRTHVRR